MGSCVALAGTDANTEIKTNLQNAVKEAKTATGSQKQKLISDVGKKITGVTNSITGDMTRSSARKLSGVLNGGLNKLYSSVYTKTLAATKNTAIAKMAGTAAQTSMVGPVSALQKNISYLIK